MLCQIDTMRDASHDQVASVLLVLLNVAVLLQSTKTFFGLLLYGLLAWRLSGVGHETAADR